MNKIESTTCMRGAAVLFTSLVILFTSGYTFAHDTNGQKKEFKVARVLDDIHGELDLEPGEMFAFRHRSADDDDDNSVDIVTKVCSLSTSNVAQQCNRVRMIRNQSNIIAKIKEELCDCGAPCDGSGNPTENEIRLHKTKIKLSSPPASEPQVRYVLATWKSNLAGADEQYEWCFVENPNNAVLTMSRDQLEVLNPGHGGLR